MDFLNETNILIKKESATSDNFGCRPENRAVVQLIKYGMVNINKQQGPSSHQIADYVKKILNIKKCGHGGTLDPNVTGVLPVALENATRIIQIFLKEKKEYVALMHIHKDVSHEEIKKVFEEFTGTIKQLPPLRSAVKRQERLRKIYYVNILEIDGKDVLFEIGCEAGTYIRKWCFDVGKRLNVGAHMASLVRTKTGPFTDKNWHSLHDLKDAYEEYKEGNELPLRKIIVPVEFAVLNIKKVWVHDSAIDHLCHGSPLYSPGVSKLSSDIQKDELIAILTLKDELIALGTSSMDSNLMLKSQKDIAVKLEKVFMQVGIYK